MKCDPALLPAGDQQLENQGDCTGLPVCLLLVCMLCCLSADAWVAMVLACHWSHTPTRIPSPGNQALCIVNTSAYIRSVGLLQIVRSRISSPFGKNYFV